MEKLNDLCNKMGVKEDTQKYNSDATEMCPTKLVSKMTGCMERVSESNTVLQDDVNRLADKIKKSNQSAAGIVDEIKNVADTTGKTYEYVEELEAEQDRMKKQNEELLKRIEEIERIARSQANEQTVLKTKINDIDHRMRRKRIVITNLDGKFDKDLRSEVFNLLALIYEDIGYDELDIVTRMGANNAATRYWKPVLVSFLYEETRNVILRNKSKINGKTGRSKYPRVWISEDSNSEVRRGMAEMSKILRAARGMSEYDDTKITGAGILIKNHLYTRGNLDKVPEKLRLVNVTTEVGDNYVAYAGEHAPLSNMFSKCKINFGGYTFSSAEQLFLWSKAEFARNDKMQQAILNEANPFTCKKMMKGIKPNKWADIELQMLEKAVKAKFMSSTMLMNELRRTGNKTLIEATRGSFWGADLVVGGSFKGQTATEIFAAKKWTGQNKMGNLLEKIRGDIFPELRGNSSTSSKKSVNEGKMRNDTAMQMRRSSIPVIGKESTRMGKNHIGESADDMADGKDGVVLDTVWASNCLGESSDLLNRESSGLREIEVKDPIAGTSEKNASSAKENIERTSTSQRTAGKKLTKTEPEIVCEGKQNRKSESAFVNLQSVNDSGVVKQCGGLRSKSKFVKGK